MEEWMLRGRRLKHSEEDILGNQLLDLDEKYLTIEDVALELDQDFENAPIIKCESCGDLVPDVFIVKKDGKSLCKVCAGKGYYSIL